LSQKHRRFLLCTGEAVLDHQLDEFPSSHIIGELLYVSDEGRKVTALARWENSCNTREIPPNKPDVDVYLIGDAREIKCRYSGCRNKERWEIGQAAFMQLMSHYGKLTA